MAALEEHAQHLLLRVLLSGPPEGMSATDATQGLAFLAMLFNVTAVVRCEQVASMHVVLCGCAEGSGRRGPKCSLKNEGPALGVCFGIGCAALFVCALPIVCTSHPAPRQQTRLLCVALGEAFCGADAAGQAEAAALLLGGSRWAADDKLMAMAAEVSCCAIPPRSATLRTQQLCSWVACFQSCARAALPRSPAHPPSPHLSHLPRSWLARH
mgnify:CR=1 FL=1